MVRHIVIWRLKEDAKRSGSIESIDRIQRCLAALRAAVPGLQRLELGINQARHPDAADLLMFAEFESWQALQGYEAHPLHDELRGLIGPLRVERRLVDYEA